MNQFHPPPSDHARLSVKDRSSMCDPMMGWRNCCADGSPGGGGGEISVLVCAHVCLWGDGRNQSDGGEMFAYGERKESNRMEGREEDWMKMD